MKTTKMSKTESNERKAIYQQLNELSIVIPNAENMQFETFKTVANMLIQNALLINEQKAKLAKKATGTKKLLTMKEATAFVTVANIKRHILQSVTVRDIIDTFIAGKVNSLKSNGKRNGKSQFIIQSDIAALKAEIKDLVKPVNNILTVIQDVDNIIETEQEADND